MALGPIAVEPNPVASAARPSAIAASKEALALLPIAIELIAPPAPAVAPMPNAKADDPGSTVADDPGASPLFWSIGTYRNLNIVALFGSDLNLDSSFDRREASADSLDSANEPKDYFSTPAFVSM